ncbi:MAG: PrsW family intramembrane metalloprotease [Lachnospiraceae bacterium]|nr:PrsW family intramembrane metalloprotease [Lachnospiraceae bacterium]
MLFSVALIPVIVLLIIIYKKDKNEKEPIGFLAVLFLAGMGTIIPAIIAELIGELIIELIIPGDSVIKAYIIAALLVGPVEELGKYVVLRLITWNSKHYNYSYDAIVYAVFVSLGFAAFENVGYVFSNGFGTAILRMFTAVPGHACFAVFMGYYYSKAKYAQITNNRQDHNRYTVISLLVPVAIHGIYDAIAMGAVASESLIFGGLSIICWFGFVLLMFAASFYVVVQASKNDFCFVPVQDNGWVYYRPAVVGSWNCTCGKVNQLNFCSECGSPRPMVNYWTCPRCGTPCTFNFCGNCGFPAGGQNMPVG